MTAPLGFQISTMSLTLHVATTNAGKLRDFAVAAKSHAGEVEFVPLPGMERIEPPPENGDTFEENARTKAMEYSRHLPGRIVLADDSGLEVDALDGAPGVRSARYAVDARLGPESLRSASDDGRNNVFLLENLRGVAQADRTARYRCVLAAARDGECIAVAHGTVEGILLDAPRGSGGFGYDPLFYLPEFDRTMAEISLEGKYLISHRGQALRELLRQILGYSGFTNTVIKK
ncbi:MAG: non-canonical purine NTP pyrophosphatase [Acidobacteriaceae bacterium]